MIPLTDSACKCFRECPRKYLYRYELGRRPKSAAGPLGFGGLVHTHLEARWTGADIPLATTDYQTALLHAMIAGYRFRWKDPREEFTVLGVEVAFEVPMLNPATGAESKTWSHAGKLDALVRDRDGDVWVVEHKTSSEDISPGSSYWKRLRLDSQVSGYLSATRLLGHEPVGVLYDVLGKPGLRPGKATPAESRKFTKDGKLYANQRLEDETPTEFLDRLIQAISDDPERYYQRGTVVRLEDEAEEAAADLWMTGRIIRESQLANRYPRNPGACMNWSRECDYFGVCTGSASINDDGLFTTQERNPELCPQPAT